MPGLFLCLFSFKSFLLGNLTFLVCYPALFVGVSLTGRFSHVPTVFLLPDDAVDEGIIFPLKWGRPVAPGQVGQSLITLRRPKLVCTS